MVKMCNKCRGNIIKYSFITQTVQRLVLFKILNLMAHEGTCYKVVSQSSLQWINIKLESGASFSLYAKATQKATSVWDIIRWARSNQHDKDYNIKENLSFGSFILFATPGIRSS